MSPALVAALAASALVGGGVGMAAAALVAAGRRVVEAEPRPWSVPLCPDNAASIARTFEDLQPGARCKHGRRLVDALGPVPCVRCIVGAEPEPPTILPRLP